MVLIRRPERGERGTAVILVAMLLVVIMIMAAFVIDLGNARQVRRQNQASSDASALAGAQELPGVVNIVATKLERYAATAMFDGTPPAAPAALCAGTTCTYTYTDGSVLTVTTPYDAGAGLKTSLVFVKTCRPTTRFFAQFAGQNSPTVCRSAVARNILGKALGKIGVIALEQSPGCLDYHFHGSAGAVLTSTGSVIADCGSAPPNSMGNNNSLEAPTFFTVGPCQTRSACVGNAASTVIDQLPSPVPDPLADLPDLTTGFGGVIQTTVASVSNLNCLDGIYYVTGTGTVPPIPTCVGKTAMLYLVSAGWGDNVKTDIVMLPPATGPYKGVSVFIARGNTSVAWLSGNSKASVTMGTLYGRDADVDWQGNIDWIVNGQVVANTYLLGGGGGSKNLGFVVNVPADAPDKFLDPDIGLEK
ncbi:MAG: hypothetical protein QOG03_502 [Actinomycetota bacterium]|jgi:Flp pilus assembly protein TadG|nr:hypothetical protein [Actinomycetota bacterium]